MGGHGKAAVHVTWIATVCMVLVLCGQAGAVDFDVAFPPVSMDGGPVVGVRITAFSNSDTSSPELIVGVPPLNDSTGDITILEIDDWKYGSKEGCNRLNVTFSGNTLTLNIGHGATCDPIDHWHSAELNIPALLLGDDSGLNVMQVNIASLDASSNITLRGLEWESVSPFGDFSSDGQSDRMWSVTERTGSSIFIGSGASNSFVADLELAGFELDGSVTSSSYVELLFGKFTPPNEPPDCVNVGPSVNTLWPPTGELWEVGIEISDPDGDPVTVQVTGIRQDEPVCDSAGLCQADAEIVNGQAKLRAKRNPVGNGRVYYIDFTAADGKNGTCAGQVVVGVPKNKGKNGIPGPDGALYNSLAASP